MRYLACPFFVFCHPFSFCHRWISTPFYRWWHRQAYCPASHSSTSRPQTHFRLTRTSPREVILRTHDVFDELGCQVELKGRPAFRKRKINWHYKLLLLTKNNFLNCRILLRKLLLLSWAFLPPDTWWLKWVVGAPGSGMKTALVVRFP